MAITLTKKQQEVYDCMKNGNSIFLTGLAGSGKSTLIKMFKQEFQFTKYIGITSTTGISALLIGGRTIHSFAGIGLALGDKNFLLGKVMCRKKSVDKWKRVQVLIIDEISMMSPDLFDKLEYIARMVRQDNQPFGGIQLILSGDFCQLPCVDSNKFCFESETWDKCVQKSFYLTEVIRQTDKEFQEILNQVRLGTVSKESKMILNSRVGVELIHESGIKPTKLYSTNASVKDINDTELENLNDTNKYEYNISIDIQTKGDVGEMTERFLKSCQAEEKLVLCKNAQVMLIFNLDPDRGLVNGSRGIIIDFVLDIPKVRFLNGVEELIGFNTWDMEDENGRVFISGTQIPLKLAWAITIHKCQGSTLDYAEIDPCKIFEYGQLYVALSRVKSLEGLTITKKIDYSRIKCHPTARLFYDSLEQKD